MRQPGYYWIQWKDAKFPEITRFMNGCVDDFDGTSQADWAFEEFVESGLVKVLGQAFPPQPEKEPETKNIIMDSRKAN